MKLVIAAAAAVCAVGAAEDFHPAGVGGNVGGEGK